MPLPVLGNLSIQDEDGKPQKENEWFKSERKLVVQKRGGRHAVYHSTSFLLLWVMTRKVSQLLNRLRPHPQLSCSFFSFFLFLLPLHYFLFPFMLIILSIFKSKPIRKKKTKTFYSILNQRVSTPIEFQIRSVSHII